VARALGNKLINPVRWTLWKAQLVALGKLYKKPSSAKEPFTATEFLTIAKMSFHLTRVGGLHARLLFMLLELGPFRPKLACGMKVEYDVVERQDGTLTVIFGPKSEVSVDHVPAVVVKVSRDKNVTALNQRLAHIPEKRHGARGHFGALSAGGTSTLAPRGVSC